MSRDWEIILAKAIYIRTSTEDQSPEIQIKDCESLVQGEYTLYKDKQSAWKDNKEREDFERLRKDISSGKIKELYVWDWDRLFRNRKKLKEFFQYCTIYKCQIHSFRQKFFEDFYKIPSPFDDIIQELVLNLMGWLAEDESKKKSDRVKLAVRKEEGQKTKSYKGNVWGRRNISDTTKTLIVEAFKQGKSYSQICSEVFYWDKNNNKKYVSKGLVHKIIREFKQS